MEDEKMKRRTMSVLLLFALLASMLPTTAQAASETAATRTVSVKNFWGLGDNMDKDFTFTVGEKSSICLEFMQGNDPDGYVFGGFVSDDPDVKASGPEYRNMVFTMPDRDVIISVNWVPENEITYVFTFNGKENSSTISTGSGATISVNGEVVATAAAAGDTITANIHPGDEVTVYSGERNSDKKKCSSWISTSPYSIPDSYLTKNSSTITFPMPSGPASLTARWSDAYWVTVKNYNGTETKDPVLYLPKEQIDIDVGIYAGHACTTIGGVTVRETGKTTWTTWHATQGIHANLIHFIFNEYQQTLNKDVDIELKWDAYDLMNVTVQDGGTGASKGGVYTCAYSPTVPISAGTKPGSTFSYWSCQGNVTITDPTQADTTVKLVDTTPGYGASEAVSATLTAHWDEPLPSDFSVILDSDGGEGATGAGSYAPGAMVTINAGTKEGYRFYRWDVVTGGVTLDSSLSAQTTFTMPLQNVTLKACWSKISPVTIVDGGAGASGAGDYAAGETVAIDAGTKPGYIFQKWTIIDANNWSVSAANVNNAQTTFSMPSRGVTATAKWTVDPNAAYTVTVSGSCAPSSGAGSYVQGAAVAIDAGTREGYTFSGWTVDSGSAVLADASRAQTTFTMPAGPVAVTANWTEDVPAGHTLTIRGLEGGDRTETHRCGEQVAVQAGTRAGYTFSCWTVASTPAFGLSGGADITFTMPDADVTLLAIWTPEPDAGGAVTLYLDELPGPLTIDEQGYRCGEPNNVQHSFRGPYILTQRNPDVPTSNTVAVTKSYNEPEFAVTLKDVNIASADQAALLVGSDAKLTLTLQGGNTLRGGANHAGLELTAASRVPETAVVINGTAQDSLTAVGGDCGAGIGGSAGVDYGTVTINGGVITAAGGRGAAGIGGGNAYANGGTGAGGSGTVIISGGDVTAAGTADSGGGASYPSGALLGAAGIGAGCGAASYPDNGPYSTITISGGTVTASGAGKAPAIGGTYTGMVYISGGTVATRRGDSQSTAEIGKCPDASGGVCEVHFCDRTDAHAGSAQIFVSGPNAISQKPASPTGTDNYYWNAIVYEGDSGQLYCSYYNSTQTMELDALTVPAGKTLHIPKGVELKLPQDGLRSDGALFAGEGRVTLGETCCYARQDGALAPCEAKLIDDSGLSGTFNTLEDLLTGTIANDGSTSWLVYSGHHILLLADVDYPADIDLTGTRCSELEIDLNGKTLNMGGHTILADVEHSTVAENNVFTISDSSPDGSGRITGNSAGPMVRTTAGRLVITGGSFENSGAGPALQIENVWPELKLSGGSFSGVTVTCRSGAGDTAAPLVSLLAEGCAFCGREDAVWISPASRKSELSNVSVQAAPAGLIPLTAAHEAGSREVSVSGLENISGAASFQWMARSSAGGASAALPGATGSVLRLDDGALEAGGCYVACLVGVNGLTICTDEVYAEASEPPVLLTVAEGTYTYNGTAHRPAVTVETKGGAVLTEGVDYTLVYEDNVNAGTAKAVVQGTESNPFEAVRKSFQIDRAPLSVQAKDQTVRQGADIQTGTAMVSAQGLVPGDTLTGIVLTKSADNTQIFPSGARIQNAEGEDAAANYEILYRPGTLIITSGSGSGGSGGSGSSSGGSGSSGGSTAVKNEDGSVTTVQKDNRTGDVTETTAYPDGSKTVVVTQRDGTVVTTETDRQGGRTERVERSDGSSSVTTQAQDGTTARTEISASGQAAANVSLSPEAAARENAVLLPIPALPARREVEQAPSVTIEAPAEGPVRVEVPVSNVTPGTVAVQVYPDGTTQVLKQTILGEAGVIFRVEAGATVKIVDNGRQFADVAETDWAASAVEFVTGRELFVGISETDFAPERPMTRGMLMTVLARLDGQDTAGGGAWYEPGVSWARSRGISDGTMPMADISREQLIVMLYRYAGSPEGAASDLPFPDTGDISGYAQAAVRWAVSSGILHGTGSGMLDPKGPATRAQTAQILENYIRVLSEAPRAHAA